LLGRRRGKQEDDGRKTELRQSEQTHGNAPHRCDSAVVSEAAAAVKGAATKRRPESLAKVWPDRICTLFRWLESIDAQGDP
jgi:hypothetical protein